MKAPHFWSGGLDPYSRESAPVLRALLTPAAWLYSAVTASRLKRATPLKTKAGVICVGNLTAGGTGKTPIVEALREYLVQNGLDAASLSRGHGGHLAGPVEVIVQTHTARDVGDEPLMLAATGKSWIARDRAMGAEAMTATGVRCIVLDDGHQNPSLEKDLSILVIDTDDPFGNGFVIPKGPLREPVKAGLSRADAFILTGTGNAPNGLSKLNKPIIRCILKRTSPLPEGPLIAFAGIGKPTKFFDALHRDGADVRDTVSYADHHVFSKRDLAFLKRLATAHDAQLVTTAKDRTRLPMEEHAAIHVVHIKACFDPQAALEDLLAPIIARART